MSHWWKCKLDLLCSLELLRLALIHIVPAWEKHIRMDAQGKIRIKNTYEKTEDSVSLAVPANHETGIRWGDLGFKKGAKGGWEMIADTSGMPYELQNLEGKLKKEVADITLHQILRQKGYQIRGEVTMENGQKKIRFLRPAKPKAVLA